MNLLINFYDENVYVTLLTLIVIAASYGKMVPYITNFLMKMDLEGGKTKH